MYIYHKSEDHHEVREAKNSKTYLSISEHQLDWEKWKGTTVGVFAEAIERLGSPLDFKSLLVTFLSRKPNRVDERGTGHSPHERFLRVAGELRIPP